MKTYFAKYLPIEGEIKEGSTIRTPTGEIVTITKENAVPLAVRTGCIKLKLFLCSRDMQIGDTAYYNGDPDITWKVDSILKDTFKSGSGEHPLNTIFKVIGEISPEAIWVKEGDEFDYQEVKITYSCEKGEECDLNYGEQMCSASHQELNLIQIKCPTCGHFH